MRIAFWQHLTVLAVLSAGTLVPMIQPAQAAQFEQQEIDPSRFIVLAAPGGELGYKLLILEQIKDSRPCWTETGSSPSSVDPLLLSFDFTGICNRIVDSNGFSVRAAGQDEALDYSLRIIPQDNDLVLVAASNSQRNTYVEIGRTNGLPPGFSRINLNPGWRLTRRAFNGKAVGHIYLTYDQPIEMLATNNLRRSTGVPAPVLAPEQTPATPVSPGVIPVPSLPPGLPAPSVPPTTLPAGSSGAPLISPSPNLQTSPSTPSPNLSTLLPPPPPPSGASVGGSAAPTARRPLPPMPPRSTAPSAVGGPSQAPSQVTSQAATNSVSNNSTPSPVAIQPAPSSTSSSTRASQTATATPAAEVFQVIVEADSAELQDKVRALAPSALLTTINGQVVMQVGVFRDRQEADRLQQRFSQEGLPTAVIPVR